MSTPRAQISEIRYRLLVLEDMTRSCRCCLSEELMSMLSVGHTAMRYTLLYLEDMIGSCECFIERISLCGHHLIVALHGFKILSYCCVNVIESSDGVTVFSLPS